MPLCLEVLLTMTAPRFHIVLLDGHVCWQVLVLGEPVAVRVAVHPHMVSISLEVRDLLGFELHF